jgi:hypothetical protein
MLGNVHGEILSTEEIKNIESEIDDAFSKSKLLELGYSLAVWTLLSVVEDHHFKIRVYNPLDENGQSIYLDGLINALTYPLQICHKNAPVTNIQFSRELVDIHYDQSNEWIDRAEDYTNFCSIFPLYHNKEIDIQVSGDTLITTDWSAYDLSYEVYDRFVAMRHSESEASSDPNKIAQLIFLNTTVKGDTFTLNFTPKLVKQLSDHLELMHSTRFSLPESWEFRHFSIGEFKVVFTTIQSMVYGWFIALQIACQKGIKALGYKSALWTPSKVEFISRLSRYAGLNKEKITTIVSYLTFGDAGVRNPDIAIQPIIDLKNGEFALSSLVWLNVNCERNLCVLLNQIQEEKKIYSMLVNEKEEKLRDEIISKLDVLGYDFKYGQIGDTDVDLAVIDRENKKCLTIELKWFIEPAEIREVIQRSKEVKKGVLQANKVKNSWERKDPILVDNLLDIDESYELLAVVAPVNSIGNFSAQDGVTPVIKTWHLVDEILDKKDLAMIMGWLMNRQYLPEKDIDYKIESIEIKSGRWNSTWYGISYA